MTAPERRLAVLAAYVDVARALNLIEDDEEREGAQAHGERLLNRHLEDAAVERQAVANVTAAADALVGGLAGLVPPVSLGEATAGLLEDINDAARERIVSDYIGTAPSVSTDPREGYAPGDPKRSAFEGKW